MMFKFLEKLRIINVDNVIEIKGPSMATSLVSARTHNMTNQRASAHSIQNIYPSSHISAMTIEKIKKIKKTFYFFSHFSCWLFFILFARRNIQFILWIIHIHVEQKLCVKSGVSLHRQLTMCNQLKEPPKNTWLFPRCVWEEETFNWEINEKNMKILRSIWLGKQIENILDYFDSAEIKYHIQYL